MKKSKKYILEQKDKYAAKINETQAFTEAYEMALETGDLDILEDLLRETDKRAEFISEIWLSFVGDKDTMLQFSTKVAIQELSSRYTPELGKKVEELYSQKKMKFFDVLTLVDMNDGITQKGKSPEEVNSLKKQQAKHISDLLDVFSDPDLFVGIHRTGGAVSGEEIQNTGLYLSGDLSSGKENEIKGEDIKTSLEKNVSFYDNNPGLSVSQVCKGGHYKNLGLKENVDIILVGVPRVDIESETPAENFASYDGTQYVLDPKYILGFATVNTSTNTIADINLDRYREQKTQNADLALEKWKNGIDEIHKDPEFSGIKNGFFKFIDKILGREPKDNTKEDDRTM